MNRTPVAIASAMLFAVAAFGQNCDKLNLSDSTGVDGEVVRNKTCVQTEKRPYGGAGGFVPGMIWLDMTPIQDIISHEPDLANKSWDFADNKIMIAGGMGYGGEKNGIRIGGGGWFGYKKYSSKEYTGRLQDSVAIAANGGDSLVDSMALLHTMIAYGGMLIERGFSVSDVNFCIGGLIGGGAMVLGKEFNSYNRSSAFQQVGSTSGAHYDSTLAYKISWAAAPLLVADVHAGMTYSMASWCQVGADVFVLAIYSADGFGKDFQSFLTLNPGFRIRILFGNLG